AAKAVLRAAAGCADVALLALQSGSGGAAPELEPEALAGALTARRAMPLESTANAAAGLLVHALLAEHARGPGGWARVREQVGGGVGDARQALDDAWSVIGAVRAMGTVPGADAAQDWARAAFTEALGDALPFFVRALYSFTSEEASGLSFERDEIIEVLACLESGWWNGVCKNRRGWFPSNYVKQVPAEHVQPMHPPTSVAPGAASTAQPQKQQQQQQQQPDAGSSIAPADQPLLAAAAAANESVYRRGSIAAADSPHGIASAVPQRLRTGRRGSAPFSTEQDAAAAAAAAANAAMAARGRAGSEGSATHGATLALTPARVLQWESRATLDGRTYYCNIFTDHTAWAVPSDPAGGAHAASGDLELIGDEATLVCMSLLRQHHDDARGAAAHGRAPGGPAGEQTAGGAWEQLAARVALAAFSLAASVG
ncbi:hypothetical protein IWQ56_003950, partial [Coemansia nantahalensis]